MEITGKIVFLPEVEANYLPQWFLIWRTRELFEFHEYSPQKADEDVALSKIQWKGGILEAQVKVKREEEKVTATVTHKDKVRRQRVGQVPLCWEKKTYSLTKS